MRANDFIIRNKPKSGEIDRESLIAALDEVIHGYTIQEDGTIIVNTFSDGRLTIPGSGRDFKHEKYFYNFYIYLDEDGKVRFEPTLQGEDVYLIAKDFENITKTSVFELDQKIFGVLGVSSAVVPPPEELYEVDVDNLNFITEVSVGKLLTRDEVQCLGMSLLNIVTPKIE